MLSAEAISEAVLSSETRLIPTGALTKGALASSQGAKRLDIRPLRGIVSYEPSEFLISARAGTPVADLQAVLREHGQYLPFDPLFVSGGSTIGGSVASGISGPNRLLYGGLRDFVMEVEFVDGLGKLVRGGGKVVKNAAGFDLPKLMVGSYGRLGILTEVTLKVFPAPQAYATLIAESIDPGRSIATVQRLLSKPLPLTALDMDVGGKLYARFAGPADALRNVLARAVEVIGSPCETLNATQDEQQIWEQRSAWIERFLNAAGHGNPPLIPEHTQLICRTCDAHGRKPLRLKHSV
jgi:glycolate oxidase FAD binding subunit